MSPGEFKAWRKALGLKQKDAAEKLGLKKRVIQYYETGKRDGRKVAIPKTVELACFALTAGIDDFNGGATPLPPPSLAKVARLKKKARMGNEAA